MRARYCVIGCLCYRIEHVINYAYFISSEYMETSSSPNLYSERLIKLTGMPHGITKISKPSDRKSRNYFDLSEKSRVFGLLHNLIKFHPDWDKILEKIAIEDEEAVFLLTGKDSIQSIQLKNRWKESAPNFLSKCRFYRRLQQDDYFNLLACSDIVLDPLHMGCGTTSIDALSLGIPIITKPEENPRTRIAYGLYKIMGIKNAPIAYTDLDYIKFSAVLSKTSRDFSDLKFSIISNYHKVISANQQSMHDLVSKIKILSKPWCKP